MRPARNWLIVSMFLSQAESCAHKWHARVIDSVLPVMILCGWANGPRKIITVCGCGEME